MKLCEMTAYELSAALAERRVSAVEVVKAVFERIDAWEEELRCYITLDREGALAAAREVDAERAKGAKGTKGAKEANSRPLAGIPVAVKDNLSTRGLPTTCGSRHLQHYIPPYDATVIEKIRAAGMIVIGKTNMDEFAMGSSTETSGFYPTRNPWDTARIPGGSSGGSAAAVAAGEAVLALGSDTGGSIRQPAAFCGVVGLKPTYGLVSRYGLGAYGSSFDQVGPLARDVRDTAMLLQVLAGYDPLDSTSIHREVPDYLAALGGDVRGLVVGLPQEYFSPGIDSGVRAAVLAAVKVLEEGGAIIKEVSLPHTEYALAAFYLIAPSECSSNLARFDGIRYGYRAAGAPDTVTMFCRSRAESFGPEVKRRIMLGTYALSSGYYDAYYLKAQRVRTLVKQDFDKAFAECQVLVTPTTPTTAFRLGEKINDPLAMYMTDICTIPVNMAALPAISVPCGLVGGLPVGLQLIAPVLQEELLLRTAYYYEQAAAPLSHCPKPEPKPEPKPSSEVSK
ncbi:MAG TPA: Asp-tRNA(Asn)/Glu-tRNA(Gln) amidotransferase subunit GatA [Firmicutes bacterium]|nr:Asp-tRNA(Asn)/Glu-tRNA(Gln) amidotransferase subunit GatA [Bacillota bacterium]